MLLHEINDDYYFWFIIYLNLKYVRELKMYLNYGKIIIYT